mmetsp:Transcript_5848/g.8619  ORF Transcript_5848/g.8619 Transcript_5848/m.8619 type:complete len:599 (+) Transcript_5848:218-2014(+)
MASRNDNENKMNMYRRGNEHELLLLQPPREEEEYTLTGLSITSSPFTTHNGKCSTIFLYSTFTLLGISQLLPWNAFTSAKSYFQVRFSCYHDGIDGDFELWFGFIFHITGVLPFVYWMGVEWWKERQRRRVEKNEDVEKDCEGNRLTQSSSLSASLLEDTTLHAPSFSPSPQQQQQHFRPNKHRKKQSVLPDSFLLPPLIVSTITFLLTTLFIFIPSTINVFFPILTYTMIALNGITCSIVGVGNVVLSRIYPSNMSIAPLMNGLAIGGLLIAILNFATSAGSKMEETHFWNLYCGAEHDDTDGFTERREDATMAVTSTGTKSCDTYTINWGAFAYFISSFVILGVTILCYWVLRKLPITAYYVKLAQEDCQNERNNDSTTTSTTTTNGNNGDTDNTAVNISTIWNTIKYPTLAIFFSLLVIFTLFPAWTLKLASNSKCTSRNRIHNDLFIPMTIIIFNVFDLLGRIVAGYFYSTFLEDGCNVNVVSKRLFYGSLVMFLFLPLFMLCHTSSSSSSFLQQHHFIIQSDIYTLALLSIMAFANGALLTLSFSHGPRLLPPQKHVQELASMIMNFVVAFAALLGSLCSFPYVWIAAFKTSV